MELFWNYTFPKVTQLDLVFSTEDAPKKLVELAKERGYYNGDTKGNKLFNEWFFRGLATTPQFKKGVDKEKAQKAMDFAVVLKASFQPKHEEKEAVCAMIFDECLDLSDIEKLFIK